MMMRIRGPLIACLLLGLGACAQPPATYKPTVGLTPDAGATVTGSKTDYEETRYTTRITVMKIDGTITEAGISNFVQWDARELLAPGPRRVEVQVGIVKFGSLLAGATVITVDARPGEVDTIRSSVPVFPEGKAEVMQVWAETADGQRRSEIANVRMLAPRRSGPLVVPATKSSPMMILGN